MPAFMFEKISPPERRGPVAATPEKQRGIIVQIIGRFTGKRIWRSHRNEEPTATGHLPESLD